MRALRRSGRDRLQTQSWLRLPAWVGISLQIGDLPTPSAVPFLYVSLTGGTLIPHFLLQIRHSGVGFPPMRKPAGEIFYGGARGGGMSDAVLGRFPQFSSEICSMAKMKDSRTKPVGSSPKPASHPSRADSTRADGSTQPAPVKTAGPPAPVSKGDPFRGGQ